MTLLHVPYTLWHLSYVVIGAALAPAVASRQAGLDARCLRPGARHRRARAGRAARPATRDADPRPRALAARRRLDRSCAIGIGIAAAIAWWPWLLAFVAFGGFIVVAYNLELFGGAFHSDLWFAVAWGAFPLLTAYAAAAETVTRVAVAAAAFAALLSLAQRRLSTPVRMVRRRVAARLRVARARRRRDGCRSRRAADARLGGGAAHPHRGRHRARRRARLAPGVSHVGWTRAPPPTSQETVRRRASTARCAGPGGVRAADGGAQALARRCPLRADEPAAWRSRAGSARSGARSSRSASAVPRRSTRCGSCRCRSGSRTG